MLIPRFSIKVLLIVTAVAAVIALVMREAAVRAEPWAIGLCATLAGVVVVFFLYIALWSAAWVWDQTVGGLLRMMWQALESPPSPGGNPFASSGPPRRLIPPREPPQ
jgi:hypothetical protein